jgi:hypothetical protein
VQSLRPTHQIYGAGQWLEDRHGTRSRRSWRKLHLAVNAGNGDIGAETLTDQNTDDSAQVEPLLNQIDGEIGQFTADGAYDGKPTYRAVLEHSDTANIVIPPRSTAVESNGDTGPLDQRDKHIAAMQKTVGWNGRQPPAMASAHWSRPRSVDTRT